VCEKLSHYVIQITLFYFSIYVHSKTFNLWKLQVVRWTVSRHTSYLLRLVERVNVRVCVFFAEAERFLSISLYMTNVRVLCNFFLILKIYILSSCSFLIVCPIYKCIVSYRYNHLSLFSRYESIPHVHDDTSKLLSFSIVTFSIILSDVHIRYVKWVLLFHQRTVFATIDIMPLIQW